MDIGCSRAEHSAPVEEVSGTVVRGESATRAPNIVLITIDTLRADRVSCYDSDLVETPNIDRFADEGVLFSNAASTVPFTQSEFAA